MDFEQTIGDMNLVIGVDADQVGVEGGMMDLALADGLWSRTGRGTAPRHRKGHGYRGRHQGAAAHQASFRDAVLSAYGSAVRSPIYPRRDCRMSLTSPWMRKSSYDSRSSRMVCR